MGVAMRALRGAVIVIAGTVFGASLAEACGTGKILFEDKFAALNPVWGFIPDVPQRSVGPNGLTYSLTASNISADRLNQSDLYQDIQHVLRKELPERGAALIVFVAHLSLLQ